METEKQYIQVYEPDKKALAGVLAECKGPDRTMAQFAEVCGISPSTLSRILNGNITKPLSQDILKSIFDNRIEGCKVTMDDLYQANGMLTVEERNRVMHGGDYRRRVIETKEQAQQIIIHELLRRGYAVKADMSYGLAGRSVIMEPRTDTERGDLPLRYDLAIFLPELHDLSEWAFEIVPTPSQSAYGVERSPESNARFNIRRTMQMRSEIFLVDAWQPERLAGMKFSWVFTDPYMYDAFKDYIKTAKLNNAMSMILLDIDEKLVMKEEWMNCPMKDDYVSLFRDQNDHRQGTDYEYRPRLGYMRKREAVEEDDTEEYGGADGE